MDKRNKVLRFVSYGIEILIFYIIQGVPQLIPEVYGGRPLLLIPIAITIASFEREVIAMAFGLACGVMLDFGVGTQIGFYTFAFTVICFFIGYIHENYFNTKLVLVMLVALIVIPVTVMGDFFFRYIVNGYGGIGYYILNHTLAVMAFTCVTVPVFYFINKAISRGFGDDYY